MKRAWPVLAILVACASHRADAPAKTWRVEGGAILDASGRQLVLRGVNLAGSHKTPPHTDAFIQADYARLHDELGFTVLRYLVTWAAIEPEKGVYDDAYLDAVGQRMEWAKAAGLLVVVDMHQDLYGEGFTGGDGAPKWVCDQAKYDAFKPTTPWFFGALDPNVEACVDAFYEPGGEPRAHFVAMWKHVAERLAKHEAIIGFDILNEPPWGSYTITQFEADKLTPFYTEVAGAVREAAPDWLVFAEPSGSRNVGYPTSLGPLPLSGVVYAPHSYDNMAEQGMGFDPSRTQAISDYVTTLRAEATSLGAALWIGEYGGDATKPGIDAYMRAEVAAAASQNAGSAYWAFDMEDGGYALVDAHDAVKPVLADAVVTPYPARVAGALQGWTYDAASRVATIRYAPDASSTAPTEIAAPTRVYPNGADVDCGGCKVETAPGLVRLATPPPGNPAVVTLRAR